MEAGEPRPPDGPQNDSHRDSAAERREWRSTLEQEVKRCEQRAAGCAARHKRWRWYYGGLHWFIGGLAALLAAAAGTTALTADKPGLTAAIAFGAAVLTAFQSLSRPEEREESHRRREAAYNAVADSARVLRTLELDELSSHEALVRLKQLQDRLHTLQGQPTFAS